MKAGKKGQGEKYFSAIGWEKGMKRSGVALKNGMVGGKWTQTGENPRKEGALFMTSRTRGENQERLTTLFGKGATDINAVASGRQGMTCEKIQKKRLAARETGKKGFLGTQKAGERIVPLSEERLRREFGWTLDLGWGKEHAWHPGQDI